MAQKLVHVDAEHPMSELRGNSRVGYGSLDYYVVTTIDNIPLREKVYNAEEVEKGKRKSFLHGKILPSNIEAKSELTTKSLGDSLGQLIYQMLDGLNLPVCKKRNIEGETRPSESFVKGILSAGQQTMFFQWLN